MAEDFMSELIPNDLYDDGGNLAYGCGKYVEGMRAEIGVKPWSVWVTYGFGETDYVDGIYPDELSALRRLNEEPWMGLRVKQVFAGEVREQLK